MENIKKTKQISHLPLIKQSRLSVMPIDFKSWKIICKMGKIWEKNKKGLSWLEDRKKWINGKKLDQKKDLEKK